MELDSKVCSLLKHCFPRIVQMFCVGKVVLLLHLPPDLRFFQSALLFSVLTGLVLTHASIYTRVSHLAFDFTLNLYFRFRQGLLHSLLASSLSSKSPSRKHQSFLSLSLAEIHREICFMLESCCCSCPVFQMFSRTVSVTFPINLAPSH